MSPGQEGKVGGFGPGLAKSVPPLCPPQAWRGKHTQTGLNQLSSHSAKPLTQIQISSFGGRGWRRGQRLGSTRKKRERSGGGWAERRKSGSHRAGGPSWPQFAPCEVSCSKSCLPNRTPYPYLAAGGLQPLPEDIASPPPSAKHSANFF